MVTNTHFQASFLSPKVAVCSPTLIEAEFKPTFNFGSSSQNDDINAQNAKLNSINVLEWMNSMINLTDKDAKDWIEKNSNFENYFSSELLLVMDEYLKSTRDVNIETTIKLAKFYMKFIKYSEIRRTTYNSKTEIITRKINKLLFFKVNQDEIFKTRLPMLSFFEGIPLNYIQSIRVHNIGNIYIEEFFDWESYYNNTAYEKPTWTLPTSEFSWRSDINSFMNELRSIIFDGKRYINPYTKTVYALLKLKGRIKWLNNKSKGSLWDQTVATAYRNVIHRKDFNDTVFLLKEYKCFLYPPFINFQRKKTELTNIVNSFNVRNNF